MESRTNIEEAGGAQLASMFARVQGMLLDVDQATHAVQQLAEAARDTVDNAVGAGASLIDFRRGYRSTGTTDRVAAIADSLQYQLDDGPCLSAWSSRTVQRVDDTSVEDRWPAWCPQAARLGLRSVLSVPLIDRGEALGALKVYSSEPGVFTVKDEQRLALLAGAAATLLGVAQDADAPRRINGALRSALDDRRSVETATGMLMERHDTDHETARDLLLSASRRFRRPLVELARDVVARSADPSL